MKYLFLSILLLAVISSDIQSQDLPKGLTPEEALIYDSFIKSYTPPSIDGDLNPPYSPVRTMAEWEEFSAVQITWTSYTQILAQMVDYIQDECLVLIVCSDSNSVKSQLTSYGVPHINLRFIYAPYNSVWCRDYGAWTIYTNDIDSLRMIDWVYNRPSRPQDDAIPTYVANYYGVILHQMIQNPNRIVATGGNFMTDGFGTAFSSKLILNENPGLTETQIDTMFRKYMGIKRYVFMETLPYDGIHHIDMHMKLLDEETLMVGQYPTGVSDGPQIELNLQYVLNNYQTCFNRPYKVVRIPMPPSSTGQYPPNSSYFTYTNSLIVNKTVMVPIYGFSQDTTALRIYRDAMPGYRVVGINCNASIPASGAIHCISKEIGVVEPVVIYHPSIRLATTTMPNYEVKASIKTKSGVSNAKVYWTADTTQGFQQLNMSVVNDTFRAYIPSQPLNTKVYYYISATSNSSKTAKKPITAPSGNFRFTVTNPTYITGNEITPEKFELEQNYPNPFNSMTNVKFQILNAGNVKITVFDLTGREVKTLVNGLKQAGTFEVIFDAGNLPSGIYFYKLEAGEFTAIKKMILLK
jgi:agmatine/peptidylarginine deiminase